MKIQNIGKNKWITVKGSALAEQHGIVPEGIAIPVKIPAEIVQTGKREIVVERKKRTSLHNDPGNGIPLEQTVQRFHLRPCSHSIPFQVRMFFLQPFIEPADPAVQDAEDEIQGNQSHTGAADSPCQGNIERAECFGINIRNYSEIIWQPFYWWKRELSN